MHKLILITVILAIFSVSSGYSQNRQSKTVKLNKQAVIKRNEGIQLFVLNGSQIEKGNKSVPVKLPVNFPSSAENAYFFFQYEAAGSDLGVVLVADYKSASPVIYFDSNNNLDFGDDGQPVTFRDGKADLRFDNPAQPDGKMTLSFSKHIMNDETEKKYLEMQKLLYKSPKAQFTLPRYWLSMNPIARMGYFRLNGIDYTIGFWDVNNDGIISKKYIDGEFYIGDRLLLAEGKQDTLDENFHKNGYKIFEDVIAFSKANIKIEEFDSLGSYVRVSSTEQPATVSRIKEGDILPSFSYKLIDNTTTHDVYALKGNGKYKLIEFWGTWCRGCVQLIPDLRTLYAEYGDRLDILSLNFNDSDLEKVAKFIDAKEMTWQQGLSTLELNRKLGVNMFPYSILVDENFKIIAIKIQPSLVKEHISKASANTK